MDLQVDLYNKIKESDLKLETIISLIKSAASINDKTTPVNNGVALIRNHLWTLMLICNYAKMLQNGKNEFIPLSKLESVINVDFNILDKTFSAKQYVEFFLSIEFSEDLIDIVAASRVIFTYVGKECDVYNIILNEFLESMNFESSLLKNYFMVDYVKNARDMYDRLNDTIKLANAELANNAEDNLDYDLATSMLATFRDARLDTGLIATYSNYSLNILTHNCKNYKPLLNLNVNWGIQSEIKFEEDLHFINIFNRGVKFFKLNLSQLCISDDLARALMNAEILFNKISKFTDENKAYHIPIDIKVVVDYLRSQNMTKTDIDARISEILNEKYTNVDMIIGDIKHFVEMFKLMKKEFFAELLKVVLLFIAEFEVLKGEK